MSLSRIHVVHASLAARLRITLAASLAIGMTLSTIPASVAGPTASPQVATAASSALPLAFAPNDGQTDARVRYEARSAGGTLYFTDSAIVVARPLPAQSIGRPAALGDEFAAGATAATLDVTRLAFVGANTSARIVATDQLPGRVNYFIGSTSDSWHTDLPTYGTLVYQDLYPGIDLQYQGVGGRLKGTYLVDAGADPTQIRWRYEGAATPQVDPTSGDLVVTAGLDSATAYGNIGRQMIERAPIAWQDLDGRRVAVATRFVVDADGSIGFALPDDYDRSQPLTLDPTLIYATYLGGSGEDNADAVAVDGNGNMYVSGLTASLDFPTTVGVFQSASSGAYDIYVAKFDSAGSSLTYATYIGGSGALDYGLGLGVDDTGNAYITGVTDSTDFPTTPGSAQPTAGGANDAYLTKLNPSGSTLLYSSYFGGPGSDLAFDIAVHPTSGVAWITGRAEAGFPTVGNAYAFDFIGGASDIFVSRVATTQSGSASLPYSSYIGGTGDDRGSAIALSAITDTVYVTGRTASADFPLSLGAAQSLYGGGAYDAFALELSPSITQTRGIIYASYLGGGDDDRGFGIETDSTGGIYVTGRTYSTDFPTSAGAPDTTCGTDSNCDSDGSQAFGDAFVTKFNDSLIGAASRVYSTYLGGERRDEGEDITVNPSTGEAYLTGYTNSTLFPTSNALKHTCGWGCGRSYSDPLIEGFTDAFVTRLNADGTQLTMSTYLGGSSADFGFGIQLDASADNIYLAGETFATDFPLVSPYQATNNGNYEVFLLKLDNASVASADLSVTQTGSPDPVAPGGVVTYVLTVTNLGPSTASSARLTHEIPEGLNIYESSATASQGGCDLIFSYGYSCALGDLAAGATDTVTVTVLAGAVVSSPVITSTVGVSSNVSDANGGNNRSVQTTTIAEAADLSVTVSDAPDPVGIGAALTYTVDIANAGPSLATGATLTDTLPAGLTFHSATPTQGSCSGTTTVVCALGDLSGGGTAQVTISVTTTVSGAVTNTVTVGSITGDPNPNNNTASASTTVGSGPALNVKRAAQIWAAPLVFRENAAVSLAYSDASACSRSAIRSSASSMPTAKRTRLSRMPTASRSAVDSS